MSEGQTAGGQRAFLWAMISVSAIVGAAAIGVFLVFRYMQQEEGREELVWQTRLGIVAESRVAAVNDWLDDQRQALDRFTSLPTIGLYTGQLVTDGALAEGDREAVATYLSTTLRLAAEQTGWMPGQNGSPAQGPAARRGLAILSPSLRPLAATPSFPLGEVDLAALPESGPVETHVADTPVIIWSAPIYGEGGGEEPVGRAIAMQPLADVMPLLRQPGEAEETARNDLIRIEGRTFSFLTTTGDDPFLANSYDVETSDLAAAFAARSPGAFGTRRRHDGVEVLVTSRAIESLPWVMVRSISVEEALGPSRSRRSNAAVIVVLATVTALIGILLIWRHGASIRVARQAAFERQRADHLDGDNRLLRSIADSQPTAILALDHDGKVRFANRQASEEAGMTPENMVGHGLAEIYGRSRAQPLLTHAGEAQDSGTAVSSTETLSADGGDRVIQSHHLPLQNSDGTLIIREDVTGMAEERERREEVLRGVMRTLLTLIDRRDPFAASQSMRAAEVARTLAETMELDEGEVDTVTYAAALMNVGKILVSKDILTKPGALDQEEMATVRKALDESARLIEAVDFDGPVAETIGHAHLFGQADAGTDATLSLYGRVVGLANAFVAMISARAWRPGLPIDDAVRQLQEKAGGGDDHRILSALNHVLDNRGGRERWSKFGEADPSLEQTDSAPL